jgi:hypothetical protein
MFDIRLQYKPPMIKYLVERGADPNSGPEDAPIWITALDKFKIREESIGYNKRDAVEVFNILKGAVPALKLPARDKVDEKLIKMFGIGGMACTFQGEGGIIENESKKGGDHLSTLRPFQCP